MFESSSIRFLWLIFLTIFSSSSSSSLSLTINHDRKNDHYQKQNNNDNNDLKTQESFTTGALGPILGESYLDNNHNNNGHYSGGGISSYDDLYKYGGIGSGGGKNILGHYGGDDNISNDGYKNYGDSEHLDQGLNKYNGHHKRDKYGGKSGNHKDYNDHHVYQRNRGYGYEKHFVYDKEYSSGKSTGSKNGHHSYYGDHDHGSKSTMDMHKNYDSKKYGTKIESNDPHLIIDNDHYDDHHGHGHSSHYPLSLDLNKMNLLKHKKELLKKHLDHQHYYHNGHHNGNHQPTIHHTYSKIHDHLPGGYSGGNSYSTHLTPFLGQTYHSGSSLLSPNSYDQQQYSGYIPQQTIGGYYDNNHPDYLDNLYLSSSSNNAKKLQNSNDSSLINTDTEGESINTLLPPGSNSGIGSMPSSSSLPSTTSSMVNMAPLISTRLSSLSAEPIEMMMIKPQQSGPEPRITTVAESFARIQNAVHATPPIISTHHYRQ